MANMIDTPFMPQDIVPSDEQLAIQMVKTRHLLVEANAGAAKTTTLAPRPFNGARRLIPSCR
jgi:DNA helicase-2/ATP-dependent DNA helicase PcrA